LIMSVPNTLVFLLTFGFSMVEWDLSEPSVVGRYYLTVQCMCWLYSAILESSSKQATLGKMALGLTVTDTKTQRIGFGQASGRYFAKYISFLILCVGFMMAGFTKRKQGLHDLIASTLVLRK